MHTIAIAYRQVQTGCLRTRKKEAGGETACLAPTWTMMNISLIARKTTYYLYVKVGARSPRPLKFFGGKENFNLSDSLQWTALKLGP